jgi:outer membrane lipoprotein carrier protein
MLARSRRPFSALALVATLAATGVTLSSGLAAPAPSAADSKRLGAALDGIAARYKAVTDFKADFKQVVHRAHVKRPLEKSGSVFYQAPGRMRWDYKQPDRVHYVSDGEVLWAYEVATKQAVRMPIRDSELYDSLKFLFGQGDLRESFETSWAGEKDGLVGVRLVPRSGQQNYRSLTLWCREGSWEIAKSELVDPLENVSHITFSHIDQTTKLKAEAFNFRPPKGAAVQDLTRAMAAPASPPPSTPPSTPPSQPSSQPSSQKDKPAP